MIKFVYYIHLMFYGLILQGQIQCSDLCLEFYLTELMLTDYNSEGSFTGNAQDIIN